MSIEETLLQKVNQQNKDIKDLYTEVKRLRTLITGNGKVGLAETVRNNERFVSNASKFFWVMVGQTATFIGLLITLVIYLLK